jgi:CRISPR associated protein Cas1
LHADKPGRFSLAYDAIEPLRPAIEASVFSFIRSNRFGANDFIRVRDAHGSLRIAESFLHVLLSECAPPSRFISDAATRMIEIILAAPRQGEFACSVDASATSTELALRSAAAASRTAIRDLAHRPWAASADSAF